MGLPGDLTTITVTASYPNIAGQPQNGKVVIDPAQRVIDSTGKVILSGPVTRQVLNGVMQPVSLPCTDNEGLNPTGFTYLVTATIDGVEYGTDSYSLPHTLGDTVDLSALAPVTTSPGVSTVYAPLANPSLSTWLAQSAEAKQIAHRGNRAIYPELSMESFRLSVEAMTAAGFLPALKLDPQWMADKNNAVIHDSTTNRTCVYTNGSALPSNDAINTYTLGSLQGIKVNATAMSGPGWPLLSVPVLEQVLSEFGGEAILFLEPKTGLNNQLVPLAREILRRQLQNSVVFIDNNGTSLIMQSTLMNAGLTGLTTMYLWNGNAIATVTPAAVIAAGYTHVGIGTAYSDADITTVVTAAHAAGKQVSGFSYTRRYDQVRMAGLSVDMHFSDDVVYTSGTTAQVTTDQISRGAMVSGLADASGEASPGFSWFGGAGFYRAGPSTSATNEQMLLGQLAPLPSPVFTMTGTIVFEKPDSDTSRWAAITLSPNDIDPNGMVNNAYVFFCRQSGGMNIFRWDAGAYQNNGTYAAGTQTTLAGATGNAITPVTTSSSLASGTPITSIPITAAAAAIPSGVKYMLPTGQVATTSGTTSSGATSMTVSSITPNATIASGSVLGVALPFTISRSNAGLFTFTMDGQTLTATDTTYSALYPYFFRATGGTGLAVSISGITVAAS